MRSYNICNKKLSTRVRLDIIGRSIIKRWLEKFLLSICVRCIVRRVIIHKVAFRESWIKIAVHTIVRKRMLVFFFPFFFSSPLHVCSILTKNLKELRFEFSRNDNESKKKKDNRFNYYRLLETIYNTVSIYLPIEIPLFIRSVNFS